MKILKLSPNGKMVQLGDNSKTASWYHVENISLDSFKPGDDVEFVPIKKNGSNFIESINKVGEKPAEKKVEKKVVKEPEIKTETKEPIKAEIKVESVKKENKPEVIQKDTDVIKKDNSIKGKDDTNKKSSDEIETDLKICKMVSETIIGIEGVTLNSVPGLIDTLFDKYKSKIG